MPLKNGGDKMTLIMIFALTWAISFTCQLLMTLKADAPLIYALMCLYLVMGIVASCMAIRRKKHIKEG